MGLRCLHYDRQAAKGGNEIITKPFSHRQCGEGFYFLADNSGTKSKNLKEVILCYRCLKDCGQRKEDRV